MRRYGKWLKPRLYLKIVEHTLLAINMLMIPCYMQPNPLVKIPGWALLLPGVVAAVFNLFMIPCDRTPCNSTY